MFNDLLLEELVANDSLETLQKMSVFDILEGKEISNKENLKNTAFTKARGELGWIEPHDIHKELIANPNKRTFDYSHLLPKAHRDNGFQLHVVEGPKDSISPTFNDKHLHVLLIKKGNKNEHIVGFLNGSFEDPKAIKSDFSYIMKPFRGQRMGLSMYEAFMAHGAKNLGAKYIHGGMHSDSAAAIHQLLAAKHGLNYDSKRREGWEFAPYNNEHYSYALKSEDIQLEELEKGWKDAIIGLSSMLGLAREHPPAINLHPQLHSISMLESSGGKNIHHKVSKKGVFDTAYGSVGFKPESAYETFQHHKDLVNKYPELKDKNKFLKKFTSDSNFYNTMANLQWSGLLKRLKDPAKAAYGWRWGEGAAKLASDEAIKNDHYVSKFKKLSGLEKNELRELAKSISDIKPGPEVEKNKFDYSHLLPATHSHLRLHVEQYPLTNHPTPGKFTHGIKAVLRDPYDPPSLSRGNITSYYRPSDKMLHITYAELEDPGLHGHGLGRAMYEAVMGHAKHHHGAETVKGDIHSSMAKRVHESLARKHGLDYKPALSSELSTHQNKEAFDNKYAPYEYHLKNENIEKNEDFNNQIDEFKLKLKDWLNEEEKIDLSTLDDIELSLIAPESSSDVNYYEEQIAIKMLGNAFTMHQALKAACFLAHKDWPSPDKIKEAMDIYEEDLCLAALYACNLDRNRTNISLLHTIIELFNDDKLSKSEINISSENIDTNRFKVEPLVYEARDAARIIQRAFDTKKIYPIKLQEGKYSKGSKIARDPTLGMLWLLKPTSKKLSPAAGIREEGASTAQREAAAYQIACLLGLNNVIPRTYLISINGRMVSAMPFLPSDFISMNKARLEFPTELREAMDNYYRHGELFKWATFDYIIGNADRHCGNLLFEPNTKSIALIDHGATFAGDKFNPGNDLSSFTPYYLRYGYSGKFKKLNIQEKYNHLIRLDEVAEKTLCNWIMRIPELEIISILDRYQIDCAPVMHRLKMLKEASGPKWAYLNGKWSGLLP